MQGIPLQRFRSYFRKWGWGWPRTFLGLKLRSGKSTGEGQGLLGQGCGWETKRQPRAPVSRPQCRIFLLPQPTPCPLHTCDRAQEQSWQVEFICPAEQWSICLDRGFCFFFFCQYVTKYMNLQRSEEGQKMAKLSLLQSHKGLEGREYLMKSVLSLPAHVLIIWTKVVGLGDMLTANAISLKVIKLLQKQYFLNDRYQHNFNTILHWQQQNLITLELILQ